MTDTVRTFAPFAKVEEQPDGTLYVEGVASTESRDTQGEVVTAAAMRKALPDYLRFPAIREMHELWAAGRALRAEVDDGGVTRIAARIVDREACEKVRQKVYNGFSIGGSATRRSTSDPSVIEALTLTEISLVDRPANPEAVFQLVKIDPGASSTEEHPRSGQGVDNRHEDAKKPVDPASPTGPGATVTSNRVRKCADCGQELRLSCACPDEAASPEESASVKAAREVARHEVAGLLHKLAEVQRDRDGMLAKLAAAEAALVKRTAERDDIQALVAQHPKGALMQIPVAVEKADDMRGEPPEEADEDEPLGPVAVEIRKLHRAGGVRVS